MSLKNRREIYFMRGKEKKLLGYLTVHAGKFAIAYIKEGKVKSYTYLSDLQNEIQKYRYSLKQEKSSLTR